MNDKVMNDSLNQVLVIPPYALATIEPEKKLNEEEKAFLEGYNLRGPGLNHLERDTS